MRSVARQNNLIFGKDIVTWPYFPAENFKLDYCMRNSLFLSNISVFMNDHFLHNPNETQNTVFFQSAYYCMNLILCFLYSRTKAMHTMPPDPGYILMYNSTQYGYTAELVKSLNQAIFEIKANLTNITEIESSFLDLYTRAYPYKFRISVYDVVASNGATWFFLPPV